MSSPFQYQTIKTLDEFKQQLQTGSIRNCVVKGLDLRSLDIDWLHLDTTDSAFFGCVFKSYEEENTLTDKNVRISKPYTDLPYNPYRATLYSPDELMSGYDPGNNKNNSLDQCIEQHFELHGGHNADILEALAQRIHDYSIDEAIKELLGRDEATELPIRKAVGVMGGHMTRRDDPYYYKTAELARLLSRHGYFIVCGGGPGIMEAANLGAYIAPYNDDALNKAIAILSKAPEFSKQDGTLDPGYITRAQEVNSTFPNGGDSLAIPTWFYGHEPVNLFASHIAKYFSNSLREDGLLAFSAYGVIFAPGSAATTEEVFINAAQNHYGSFGYHTPMVFLGENHYLQSQVYQCLTQQAAGNPYAQLITISDEPIKLLNFIEMHKPLRKAN
jgi:predicted Rossmann-fold nucleotide-binding protein